MSPRSVSGTPARRVVASKNGSWATSETSWGIEKCLRGTSEKRRDVGNLCRKCLKSRVAIRRCGQRPGTRPVCLADDSSTDPSSGVGRRPDSTIGATDHVRLWLGQHFANFCWASTKLGVARLAARDVVQEFEGAAFEDQLFLAGVDDVGVVSNPIAGGGVGDHDRVRAGRPECRSISTSCNCIPLLRAHVRRCAMASCVYARSRTVRVMDRYRGCGPHLGRSASRSALVRIVTGQQGACVLRSKKGCGQAPPLRRQPMTRPTITTKCPR
jgi:hypothetical protein